MIPIVNDSIAKTVNALKQRVGEEIPSTFVSDCTMEAIIATAFGSSFDAKWMADSWKKWFSYISNLSVWYLFFGRAAYFLPVPSVLAMRKIRKETLERVKLQIAERKKAMESESVNNEDIADLLTLMIRSGEATDESIMNEGLTFLAAGFESTSGLIQWTLYFLGTYPEVQEKLISEIDAVVGSNEVTAQHMSKLLYCKHVIQETLRMRPPIVALDRLATEDCELDGVKIRKGTDIVLFWHNTHLDPTHWTDPLKFIPERWEKDHHHPFAFVPFSAAERNCIGQKFAYQEVMIFLTMMLQHFRVETVSPENVVIGIQATIKPVNLKFKFHSRTKN